MECLDTCDELSEHMLDNFLGHGRATPFLHYIVLEVTGRDILRDDVKIGAVLEVVEQLDHVGGLTAADQLHDFDLSVGLPQQGKGLLDGCFVDNFDDEVVPRVFVLA